MTVACLRPLLFAMGKFIFDQGLMRRHLLKCLENKLMDEFPVRKECRNSDKVINHDAVMVHCSCRMPKTKDEDMIACSSCREVYLKNLCVEVIAAYSLEEKWICTNCSY